MRTLQWIIVGLALVSLLGLAACSGGGQSSSDASKVVVDYLQALVDRQANQMINLSCTTWEESARVEYDAFAAVKLQLKDPSCKDSGQEGEFTLVNCRGAIIANYGAEDQKIDLAERTYKVVQQNGEWRMCGYR